MLHPCSRPKWGYWTKRPTSNVNPKWLGHLCTVLYHVIANMVYAVKALANMLVSLKLHHFQLSPQMARC